jgi:tetratricopeptide (TPR) repeat protein
VFDSEIRESIDQADVFVLLVTPHIAEKGNYVLAEEYPYAVKCGKPIVAVEMERPKWGFLLKFPNVRLVKLKKMDAVFRRILSEEKVVKEIGADRSYYLGRAYLQGIFTERDQERGLALLSNAGENHYPQAIEFLLNTYRDNSNYSQLRYWASKAETVSHNGIALSKSQVARIYLDLIATNYRLSDFEQSEKWIKKAFAQFEDPDDSSAVERSDYAKLLHETASFYFYKNDYEQAIDFYEKALTYYHPVSDELDRIAIHNNLGAVYMLVNNYPKAEEHQQAALEARIKLWGPDAPQTAMSYQNIARYHWKREEYQVALGLIMQAIGIFESYWGRGGAGRGGTYHHGACL